MFVDVVGLVNLETSVPIGSFPIGYQPVDYRFFEINTQVSGVAFNVASALKVLGAKPTLLSLYAQDLYAAAILQALRERQIEHELVAKLQGNVQTVVLYDDAGSRRICLDLKDVQDHDYPLDRVVAHHQGTTRKPDLAVVCNTNLARGLLNHYRQENITVASDVHALADCRDDFNQDFISGADILFLSNEYFVGQEVEFINELKEISPAHLIVVGCGSKGALLYERKTHEYTFIPALQNVAVRNTVGAGDALFSAFNYFYFTTRNARKALRLANIFAAHKITISGGSKGFLSAGQVLNYDQPTTQ